MSFVVQHQPRWSCTKEIARTLVQVRSLLSCAVRCAGFSISIRGRDLRKLDNIIRPSIFRSPLVKSGIRRAAKRLSGVVKQWIKEDFYGYPSHASTPGRRFRKCLLWPEQLRRVFRGREIIPWVGRGRLLDVGCGTGRNLVALTELGWDVYGVDISEAAVQSARSQFGHRVRHGDLKSISYSDGSFDVVLFSHSLEHMYSPVSVL
ncbi:MAG: hypothetical protein C4293_15595, partial [Nitrospiraceae bacterium]